MIYKTHLRPLHNAIVDKHNWNMIGSQVIGGQSYLKQQCTRCAYTAYQNAATDIFYHLEKGSTLITADRKERCYTSKLEYERQYKSYLKNFTPHNVRLVDYIAHELGLPYELKAVPIPIDMYHYETDVLFVEYNGETYFVEKTMIIE